MVLIPTYASEMSGVLSKLLDKQFFPLVASIIAVTEVPHRAPAQFFFSGAPKGHVMALRYHASEE